MRYIKPHYYDEFVCAADQCPATCCAGWQIVIDEDSLERYEGEGGDFGNRLRNSIDWEEGVFYQYDSRCSFLNEKNLCDIYEALGPDALCGTCRMYPRHTEEYEGLRELSLSLSCPVAAKMILGCEEKLRFLEEATEEEEEFEDFDFLMFTQLEDAREVIFHILQNRALDMRLRMDAVERLAAEFQECIDDGRGYDIDGLLEKYEQGYLPPKVAKTAGKLYERRLEEPYERRLEELKVLEGLERLRPEWSGLLRRARRTLFGQGPKRYEEIRREFQESVGYDSPGKVRWENTAEQLMMFFVYTYFCGSVYDDMVYSKMGLALFSTEWIQELLMLRWLEKEKQLAFEDAVEISWRLAREIEHSDNNLNALEDWLDEKFRGAETAGREQYEI